MGKNLVRSYTTNVRVCDYWKRPHRTFQRAGSILCILYIAPNARTFMAVEKNKTRLFEELNARLELARPQQPHAHFYKWGEGQKRSESGQLGFFVSSKSRAYSFCSPPKKKFTPGDLSTPPKLQSHPTLCHIESTPLSSSAA